MPIGTFDWDAAPDRRHLQTRIGKALVLWTWKSPTKHLQPLRCHAQMWRAVHPAWNYLQALGRVWTPICIDNKSWFLSRLGALGDRNMTWHFSPTAWNCQWKKPPLMRAEKELVRVRSKSRITLPSKSREGSSYFIMLDKVHVCSATGRRLICETQGNSESDTRAQRPAAPPLLLLQKPYPPAQAHWNQLHPLGFADSRPSAKLRWPTIPVAQNSSRSSNNLNAPSSYRS